MNEKCKALGAIVGAAASQLGKEMGLITTIKSKRPNTSKNKVRNLQAKRRRTEKKLSNLREKLSNTSQSQTVKELPPELQPISSETEDQRIERYEKSIAHLQQRIAIMKQLKNLNPIASTSSTAERQKEMAADPTIEEVIIDN